MWKRPAVLLMILVFAGCASNVYVPYPQPADAEATGRVIIRFTEPMESVNVQIDGSLVAEDEHTERVEIQNVPVGKREVEVAASEDWRKRSVDHREVVTVEANRDATILIDTPPYSTGYWIFRAAVWLAALSPAALVF